jgi:hypothetical protein
MTQNLEQIKYFDEKLETELNKSQPNQEQIQFYRSQIDKLTSSSIPQPSAGKCIFKILFFTNIHIEYIFYIISDFFRHFYRVETIFFDDFIY